MKNIFFKFALLAFVLIFLPNRAECQAKAVIPPSVTNFKNNPLPHKPASLKILGIGNSFTDDGMEYLPDLLKSAGIDQVTLGKLSLGGCSLERHYQLYLSGDSAYNYRKSYPGKNVWEEVKKKCTFKEAVSDESWDIIIIQQVSGNSGRYETYQPYLNHLISAMIVNCPNAGVTLGWQMTWAYATNSNHKDFSNYNRDQQAMYQSILQAVKTMVSETGIDLVIPSGTAIQNLRTTSLNNSPLDLTRDGYHIDLGVGRYTLACTWFQTLIAPCLGQTIAGNPFRTGNGNIPVTGGNFRICQQAAQYACSQRFEVTPIAAEP